MKQNYRNANEEISGLRLALEESRANGDRLHRESELVVHNVNTWVQEQKCVSEDVDEIQAGERECLAVVEDVVFEGTGLGSVQYNEEGVREIHYLALGGGDWLEYKRRLKRSIKTKQ